MGKGRLIDHQKSIKGTLKSVYPIQSIQFIICKMGYHAVALAMVLPLMDLHCSNDNQKCTAKMQDFINGQNETNKALEAMQTHFNLQNQLTPANRYLKVEVELTEKGTKYQVKEKTATCENRMKYEDDLHFMCCENTASGGSAFDTSKVYVDQLKNPTKDVTAGQFKKICKAISSKYDFCDQQSTAKMMEATQANDLKKVVDWKDNDYHLLTGIELAERATNGEKTSVKVWTDISC